MQSSARNTASSVVFRSLHLPPNSQFMFVFCCKTHSYDNSRLQVPKGAGHLLHRPVDLDLNVGPSAIPVRFQLSLDTW